MKEKKGFISTSIIYSFFLVFILLMIAFLMSFINKRYLIDKTNDNLDVPPDVLACTKEKTLSECLFKSEYIEYVNPDVSDAFKNKNGELANASFTEESIKDAIKLKGTPDFEIPAKTEEGMFAAEDDYGTSYYYRGAEDDNYVVFAGFVWQIVRVNGDGSIRMIYKGQWDYKNEEIIGKDHVVLDFNSIGGKKYETFHFYSSANNESDLMKLNLKITLYKPYVESECAGKSVLGDFGNKLCPYVLQDINDKYIDNILDYMDTISNPEKVGAYFAKRLGYMGNDNTSLIYDERFANENDSIAKTITEAFYENALKGYETFLNSKTIFCGDKNMISTSADTDDIYEFSGYNRYNSYELVSLKCVDSGLAADKAKNAVTNLSRYNVDSEACSTYDCNNNNKWSCALWVCTGKCDESQDDCSSVGNGQLTYPVGLISMDELFYAGATRVSDCKECFLKGSTQFWTMTPSFTSLSNLFGEEDKGARYFSLNSNGKIEELNDTSKSGVAAIRPVINLKSDILYCGGDGASSNPYIIGNGSCS